MNEWLVYFFYFFNDHFLEKWPKIKFTKPKIFFSALNGDIPNSHFSSVNSTKPNKSRVEIQISFSSVSVWLK